MFKYKHNNTVTLFTQNVEKQLLSRAYKAVNEATNKLFLTVKMYSPIDTWKYLSGHRNLWVRYDWNKVIWTIANETEYASKVEYGWRVRSQTKVNWHLYNIWQIYFSVWANVYTRSMEIVTPYFLKQLKWK